MAPWRVVPAGIVVLALALPACTGSGDGARQEGPASTRSDGVVWLDPDATSAEVAAVRDVIDSFPLVSSSAFRTGPAQYEEFVDFYSDSERIISVDPEAIPSRLDVVVVDDAPAESLDAMWAAFEILPGVNVVLTADGRAYGTLDADDGRSDGHDTQFVVWLQPDATDVEIDAVGDRLGGIATVTIEFVDQERAYDEFVEHFSDDEELIDTVRPGDLPPSFRVHVEDIDAPEVGVLIDELRSDPAVRTIVAGLPRTGEPVSG